MIEQFEVQNYKSIKALDLKMGPFMVLVGPNGAGKTNIVRAMELFGRVLRAGTVDPIREVGYDQLIRRESKPARGGIVLGGRYSIDSQAISRMLRYIPGVAKTNQPKSLVIEGTLTVSGSVSTGELKIASEKLRLTTEEGSAGASITSTGEVEINSTSQNSFLDAALRFSLGFPSPDQLKLPFPDLEKEVLRTADPEHQSLRLLNWQRAPGALWLRQFRDGTNVTRLRLESSALRQESMLEEQSRERILGPSGEGLAAAVYRMRGPNEEPKSAFAPILSALQDVYPRIEDIRAERTGTGRLFLVFKERGISQDLGQSNVSDGVMHALALLLAINGGLGGDGILVIEEPENAIHPWSLRSMIRQAQEVRGRQIVLTTHSEIVVNEVTKPESLWVVESSDAGTTVTEALHKESALRSIMEKTGEKLGDIWLGGGIGGVPGGEV